MINSLLRTSAVL